VKQTIAIVVILSGMLGMAARQEKLAKEIETLRQSSAHSASAINELSDIAEIQTKVLAHMADQRKGRQ
jgi:hypothetical protein